MEAINKPYPNEHSARLIDPGEFDRFRRENDKFGAGIHAIWGIKGSEGAKLQSIRFDASKFTAEEAKAWLAEHKYKPIAFEPAKGKEADDFVKVNLLTTWVHGLSAEAAKICIAAMPQATPNALSGLAESAKEIMKLEHLPPDEAMHKAVENVIKENTMKQILIAPEREVKAGEPIRKNFITPDETKEFDDAAMTITHFVSTETVDRMGDIVRAEGIDDTNYRANPIVLYGHDDGSFPIGKSVWRKVVDRNGVKGYLAKTQLHQFTEEAKVVYNLWKGGYLNASSVAFMPVEFEPLTDLQKRLTGYDFKKIELLEYSIVPVPANQEALRNELEMAVTKGLLKRTSPLLSIAKAGAVLNQKNKSALQQAERLISEVLASAETDEPGKAAKDAGTDSLQSILDSADEILASCDELEAEETGEGEKQNDTDALTTIRDEAKSIKEQAQKLQQEEAGEGEKSVDIEAILKTFADRLHESIVEEIEKMKLAETAVELDVDASADRVVSRLKGTLFQ